MEAMVGSYDDVCAFAGGPKRLARVAALLAKSDVPAERERGARALAFITSSRFADRADAAATKASLLADGAVASLLAMLCPEEEPEPEPMDEDDDTDEEEEDEDDEDDGSRDGSSSSSSMWRRSRSRNDIARSTEMFAAAALLNVSSLPAAQIALAKRGLYTLLKTNASLMTSRTSRFVGGGEVTGGDLIAGCIHNVAGHPSNRTRMYKLELRAKAMERVLHNRRSARHVGHKAAQAARLVGDAHERAAAAKTTFEKVTRRRRRVDAFTHAPDPRAADPKDPHPAKEVVANAEEDLGGGVAPPVAAESSSAAAPPPGEADAADADAAPGPAARDSGSESDWSSSDGEDDAIARGDASAGRAAIRADDFPRAQADDDWLAGMMTRYAQSEAGESARISRLGGPNVSSAPEDAVFADGLALLAHSMRAPLRRVWAKPTRAPDARVTGDPEWTANRGATRVVMAEPPRGAPRGDARWRPPVREYRERGATRSFVEEETFRSTSAAGDERNERKRNQKAQEKDAFFVEPTARRLLTASIPPDATARLAGKAAEVAAEVAFGAPDAFGGLGSDATKSGLAGSLRAPDPSLPVARASFARHADERTRDHAERRASSGGADASASAAENDAEGPASSGAAAPEARETANDEALLPNPSRDQDGAVLTRDSVPEPNEVHENETRGPESTNEPEGSPLEVVLEPCAARRVVSFGAERARDGDSARDSRVARLSVFEHTPGARAHLDAGIPAYRLPNGKRAFYYLAGGDVVGETSVFSATPPPRPTTLRLAMRRGLGLPASSGALRDAAALFFPEEFRPAPALCALPTRHTLVVADPRELSRPSAFGDVRPRRARLFATEVLTRRTEEEHALHAAHKKAMSFDGSKKGSAKAKRGVSFVEETDDLDGVSEEIADFDAKEAFDPRRHSVFATRGDTADARDVFDGDSAYDAAFDADWRAWTRDEKGERFLTLRLARVAEAAVNAGEVLPRSPRDAKAELRAVARAYYDEIARAHRRFAAEFSSTADFFPASAEACLTRAVTLPRAGFDALAKKCAFAQTRTKCTEAHIGAFYETVAGSASAPLTRAQFLELLVRVADAKYAKSGAHHSLARALEALCENDFLPRAGADFLADPDVFRAKKLYLEETDDVFRGDIIANDTEEEEKRLAAKFDEDTGARRDVSPPASPRWRALRALFLSLADDTVARVGFGAFAEAMAMAGVLETSKEVSFDVREGTRSNDDDDGSALPSVKTRDRKKKLSVSHARRVFLAAQTFVARAAPPRDATLAFEDFLEALARVADAVPTPEDEPGKEEPRLAEDDDKSATSETTASKRGAESTSRETANAATDSGCEKNGDAPEGEAEGDLEEEAFAARSLASKLDEFLEHVLRRAWRAAGEDADAYDAERAAEAIEGLTL